MNLIEYKKLSSDEQEEIYSKLRHKKQVRLEKLKHRCEEDVKINANLWHRQQRHLEKLYDGGYKRLTDYLTFKMWCAKLQQESKWKLDFERCEAELFSLNEKIENITSQLESKMPKVTKYREKTKPKVVYKKDGTLSHYGRLWMEDLKQQGLPEDHDEPIKVVSKIEEPNAGSSEQIKDWLFGYGWKPCTFNEGANGPVPQIRDPQSKELTNSVLKLIDKHPEVKLLENLTMLQHRYGMLKGFLRDVDEEGFLTARIAGLTNTLRFKHSELVNLPGIDKPYGKVIRGVLTARDDEHELVGSDINGLEDSTKQHYIYPYDKEYVKEMRTDDFDPHIDVAILSGLISEREGEYFKYYKDKFGSGKEKPTERQTEVFEKVSGERKKAKTVNFSSVYGVGAKKLSTTLDITKGQAKKLLEAYWDRNWAVKRVESSCRTKKINGQDWLYNPVAGLWYSLRNEKDKFSTLNQGTGAYCFDMFLGFILSKRKQLTGQFHDEFIIEVKKGYREEVTKLIQWAMDKANKALGLNVDLSMDVQFGKNYSEIH